ncbi:MAG: hypothetical protein U9O87_08045 [Verrucomicrobiota bacterium]|nr:hypothetical protein [Verrucomicrobiota bacterium]
MALIKLKKKFYLYLLVSSMGLLLLGAKQINQSLAMREIKVMEIAEYAELWGNQMTSEVPANQKETFKEALKKSPEIIYFTANRQRPNFSIK